MMLELGAMILERLGYHVTVETDSLEALKLFRSNAGWSDLVITDCTMPKLTGTDLAKEIHRIRPGNPISMCTGFTEKTTPDTSAQSGFQLLMKPFAAKDMAELVRKMLDKRG